MSKIYISSEVKTFEQYHTTPFDMESGEIQILINIFFWRREITNIHFNACLNLVALNS
ncbi:hypothetical protein Lalb_Chr22g0355511 [Lupinus albus]|uniref:Uncharacterized protein n=1 Tax=Lupinus albus TaxID=3870 RepID=A0A6A4N151_LUPAL|nr:hypothetical protein Lalb_Chr22g0355511 [Lupinus albus]